MSNAPFPDRRERNELLEYRLNQIEKKLEQADDVISSISKDQMRFRLDDHKMESLSNTLKSMSVDLEVIKSEMPLLIHFKKRVDIVLKSLLSAFATAMIGSIVYFIKMSE